MSTGTLLTGVGNVTGTYTSTGIGIGDGTYDIQQFHKDVLDDDDGHSGDDDG